MRIQNNRKSFKFAIPLLLLIPLILFSLQLAFNKEKVTKKTENNVSDFMSPTVLKDAFSINKIIVNDINNIHKDSICSIHLINEFGRTNLYYVYNAPLTSRQLGDKFFLHIYLKDNKEWAKSGKGKFINLDFYTKPVETTINGKTYFVFKRLFEHKLMTLDNIDYINTGRFKKGISGRSYGLSKLKINNIPLSNRLNNLENIVLTLKEKDYDKLSDKRKSALEIGILTSEDSDFVKATISSKHIGRLKSELRLKGDWTDHLTDSVKWSFKVKLEDENTFFGMRKFSIQQPKARNYVWEWLFNKSMKDNDLVGLRYDFINVDLKIAKKNTTVNKIMGIMAIEESFDKYLIENNKRREGIILNFDESLLWADRSKQRELNLPSSTIDSDLSLIDNAPISVFNESKVLSSPILRKQFNIAKNLLNGLRKGELKISEVFDLDKLTFYVALSNLFGGHHGLIWHNLRIYYNPVTNKLEPVSYDSNSGTKIDYIRNYIFYENDDLYKQKLVEKLELVSSSEFINNLLNSNYNELNSLIVNLNTEFDINFDRSILEHNSNFIKKQIHPSDAVITHLYNHTSNEMVLRVYNISNYPITINSLKTFKGTILSNQIQNSIILPDEKKIVSIPLKSSFINAFVSKKNKKGEFRYPKDVSKIHLDFNILGSKHNDFVNIIPYKEEDADFVKKYNQFSDLSLFEFITVNENEKNIVFKSGTYKTNKIIRIPSGYTVQIEKGFSLDLSNKASLLSYSPMICKGTKTDPITFKSSDGTGNGIFVSNCDQISILDFCHFSNLSNPNVMDWSLSGAVNFNEANVRITNSTFENNRCEDGLNIIRSDFYLGSVNFKNTFSDAFDGDFVTGKLENCSFLNSGNDGIDVSGSSLEIKNVVVTNASDKAISIGEGSKLTGGQVKIVGGEIGVVSKDLSIIELDNVNITDSKLAISSFQKKSEYGPGTISLTNLTLIDNTLDHLIEENSELSIEGKLVETKSSKVIDKMYGNEYGKSSK
ncbi:right-handed parallel beta-helix repeat-containing protein [Maribacter stanieri]|uniref:Right handed beta helix region n=1 Tax=Maribacter stanieri TaxID=440514 RepID=A0A1I6HUX1_9FLAO|nr:right-handed parallel beta-helix repeat-containing protein [Maribacter stanieri]SFR58241.1 hypothetical protein SAMN04488010_0803 [Maribacter stanieri]